MEVREAQVVDPTHLELAHPTQVPPGAKGLDKMEKNRNFYCEKIWVHRDDLAKFEQETKRTVRPMSTATWA